MLSPRRREPFADRFFRLVDHTWPKRAGERCLRPMLRSLGDLLRKVAKSRLILDKRFFVGHVGRGVVKSNHGRTDITRRRVGAKPRRGTDRRMLQRIIIDNEIQADRLVSTSEAGQNEILQPNAWVE